jgi:hypothetical protein
MLVSRVVAFVVVAIVLAIRMPTCLAQVSPIECIFALSEADANGDLALDRNEYQAVLLDLAAVQIEGGCRIDSVALQSQYDEAACSCQHYTTGATTLPKATMQATPACLCRQAGATIAVPQVYPAAYSLTICHGIAHLLQTSCAAVVVVVGTDMSSLSTTTFERNPQTANSSKVPMSVMFASVVIVGTIVGATAMAVWLRLIRQRRRRSTGPAPPGHKQSLDGSGQSHGNNSIDVDLHRWAAADSADPSGRTTCTAVLDDDSDGCWVEFMEEGSVSPVTTSPVAGIATKTNSSKPRLRGSELNVCTLDDCDHVKLSCAQATLLQLPTLEAKSSCMSLEMQGGDSATDDSDNSVHDAPQHDDSNDDNSNDDNKWPETKLREAREMTVATTQWCPFNPALDTGTDAADEEDSPNSGPRDQTDHQDKDRDDVCNVVAGSADVDQLVAMDVESHGVAAVVLVGTIADSPDGYEHHGCTTLSTTTTTTTTSTSTKQRSHGHKALVCHRRKRHAVVAVRSVKTARAAYMAQARSVRSGGARLQPIPETTLTRAQRITI